MSFIQFSITTFLIIKKSHSMSDLMQGDYYLAC
nr:MAG TPA: hypothetical protein [Caudoviricetes sp.]